MTTTGEDLARVTIISPTRRIDLALPGATTLGEIMPSIVQFSGFETGTQAEVVHEWVLQRVGEDPLDPNQLVSALNVRDGETLHLRRRAAVMPDVAFDDVVDAVATTAERRPSWMPQHSQRLAIGLLCVILVGFPTLLLWSDHTLFSSLLVIGLAAAAGVGAIVLSRAFGCRAVAGALSWCAVVLAGIGGYFMLSPGLAFADLVQSDTFALMLLVASAAVVFFSAILALTANVHPYQLLATAITALVILIVAIVMVAWRGHGVQIAAVGVAVILASTSRLPWLCFHIAQIATPNLPANAELMIADETPVQSDIVARAIVADRLLAAFLTASAASAIVLAIPVISSGTWMALSMMGCVAVALLLRGRAFIGLTQRLVCLVSGAVIALGVLGWLSLHPSTGAVRFIVGIALVALATWAIAQYAATMYNRILAPTWGRWGDILEWLAIIGIIPLLLAVLNVYAWARGLNG